MCSRTDTQTELTDAHHTHSTPPPLPRAMAAPEMADLKLADLKITVQTVRKMGEMKLAELKMADQI